MRQVIVVLSQAGLLDYLIGRRVLVNVPADARLVGCWRDIKTVDNVEVAAWLVLRLEHESFVEIEAGSRIPVMKARYRNGSNSVVD